MTFGNLELVDSNFVYKVESGSEIVFEEKGEGGEGKVKFRSGSDVLVVKARNKAPVVWALKNKKCGEAAFISKDSRDGSFILHILEMKSSLTLGQLRKSLLQLEGMYLSAICVMAVLGLGRPAAVKSYIAYSEDKVAANDDAQPVLKKVLVGGRLVPGRHEWMSGTVNFSHGVCSQIVKGKRVRGDFDFGFVA